MNEKALLLGGPAESLALARLEKILAFLGVESVRMNVAEFLSTAGGEPVGVLCPAATFLELAAALEKNSGAAKKIRSAFVFGGDDAAALQKLARQITGDAAAAVTEINQKGEWNVTDKLPEFCRAMSGVNAAAKNDGERALVFGGTKSKAEKIISANDGTAFARFDFHSVPVFVSTAEIIDLAAPLSARVFDVRAHFLASVPVVMYVKWAFAATCWQPAETCACLVIDDPLLRPRYGFLNFEKFLRVMEQVNFSTSIAFIPWNWNRSSRRTVRLFQENPGRYSLSVHGCDHTGGEYGDRSVSRLSWRSKLAMERMARHQKKTGLAHDRVMVFPQGVFSAAAMTALKHNDFIGTVNSEVFSADAPPPPISVGDYWNPAVMNFSDFPIFTRRYPWAGAENFAFDILLGKPCLVVVHQNDCHDDYRHVTGCIARLNQLNARLRWTNLAEVVRRSFRQREISPGVVAVEIFGSEARLENLSATKKMFRVFKREADSKNIQSVRVDGREIKWTAKEKGFSFEIGLNPGENRTVSVAFKELPGEGYAGEGFVYRMKTLCRRRLCEARDNYLLRKKFSQ